MMLSDAPALTNPYSIKTYLEEIDHTALLQEDTERELAYRVGDGDAEARDHLVRANLRLVVRIARDFVGRGMSLPDLIQEGNLGLMRAVEGFDPAVGTRFSTYASYWIKQSMQRAIENTALPVRVPAYALDLVTEWRRTAGRLHEELGRPATRDEIARTMRLSAKKLKIVEKALRIFNGVASATAMENDMAHFELAADNGDATPDTQVAVAEEMQQILRLVDTLDARSARVLKLRYGLEGGEPLTLNAVGECLDLTRERVRQIERDALMQLREKL
jgi:RNA polymerase primary sigma factor